MNPPEEYQSTRIISLLSENFKRLRAVCIRPDGNMVKIVGKNGAGKSSVLDSIASALGGGDSTPADPIRHGAKKARIVLELEDLTVTRTFTKSGTTLVIEGKDGLPKKSPQELLNRLTGKVTFDPLEFLSLKAPQKRDTLRALVGLDTSKIDAEAKKAYDERTNVNRELAQQKAVLANLPLHKDAPTAEESSADILAEIDKIHAHNQEVQKRSSAVSQVESSLRTHESDLADSLATVTRLKAELAEAEKFVTDGQQAVTIQKKEVEGARNFALAVETKDAGPLKDKLFGLEQSNAKVRANDQRKLTLALVETKQGESDRLTRKIEDCDEKKQAMLEAIKFPVEGLAVSDEGVSFNGVPLEQASDAEKLRISVAIAAAENPKLKIMLARNASLLDEDSLKLLAELAEKHGLQVWLEVVSSTDKTGVVIEDGHLAGEETPPETEAFSTPDASPSEQQSTLEIPPSR